MKFYNSFVQEQISAYIRQLAIIILLNTHKRIIYLSLFYFDFLVPKSLGLKCVFNKLHYYDA